MVHQIPLQPTTPARRCQSQPSIKHKNNSLAEDGTIDKRVILGGGCGWDGRVAGADEKGVVGVG